MSRNVSSPVPVEYPSSDGRPMAENDWQLHAMIDAISVLDRYFEDRMYVSGDLLIYYEEGNPKARAAPYPVAVGRAGSRSTATGRWRRRRTSGEHGEEVDPGSARHPGGWRTARSSASTSKP